MGQVEQVGSEDMDLPVTVTINLTWIKERRTLPIQTIINQSGPLPITTPFVSPTDAPAALFVSGSVWSQFTNTMIGIAIILDGQQIGAAQIFSNGTATHRAVVPVFIPIDISIGNHTLSLNVTSGETVSDSNDFYTATLVY